MPGKESQFTATEAETHDFGVEVCEGIPRLVPQICETFDLGLV